MYASIPQFYGMLASTFSGGPQSLILAEARRGSEATYVLRAILPFKPGEQTVYRHAQ
jgi:hypothetical protein